MGLVTDALDTRKNGEFIKNEEEHWNDMRAVLIALEGGGGLWTRQVFAFGLFATAGLTFDIEAFSLPARGLIDQVLVKSRIAFAGGAISDVKADVGIGGDLTRYINQYDLDAGVNNFNFATGIANDLQDFGAATSIRLQLTSVGANLDQLAAGEIEVYIRSATLPTA